MAQAISNTTPKKSPLTFSITGAPTNNSFGMSSYLPDMRMKTSTPAIHPNLDVGKGLYINNTGQVASRPTTNPSGGLMSTSAPSSPGSYRGVPITAGSQADIQAQMARIDAAQNPTQGQAQVTSAPATPVQSTAAVGEDRPKRGLFENVVSSLARYGKGTPEAYAMGQDKYAEAVARQEQLKKDIAQKIGDIESDAIPLEFQQGRKQALARQFASQEAAAAEAVTQAQQALQFGLTQQQLQQQALGTAATYAQPSISAFGQTVFDPLTGTFKGGSGQLDPNVVAQQLAQDVLSGRKTYEQAVASLGYAGGAGQQFLNNALQGANPNFNIPLQSATITGQTGVYGQLPGLEAADVAAEGIKNKITSYLAANPQLNPSALAAGNTLQQWIQGKQLSDPKYQTLFNYLNEYTNTLAPILGVGGDATNLKTQIAQSFINAAASGQSIAEVLENTQALSKGKLQDIRSGATGGGVVSSPTTSPTGSEGGLFDW